MDLIEHAYKFRWGYLLLFKLVHFAGSLGGDGEKDRGNCNGTEEYGRTDSEDARPFL